MLRFSSDDSHFVSAPRVDSRERKVVSNPPMKLTKAASCSFGKTTRAELVEYDPSMEEWENWIPNDIDIVDPREPGASILTGFGERTQLAERTSDSRFFPIEHAFGELTENDRMDILQKAAQGDPLARRIRRDPVTRIPENTSWADPTAESDKFYGADKHPKQFDPVLDRMKTVDRGRERVDYRSSKAIPIKVVRRD